MAQRSTRKQRSAPARPPAEIDILLGSAVRTIPWKFLLQAALIIGLGVFIYYPSLYGRYLWDDDFLIQNNPVVHDPKGLFYIWTDPEHALIDFFPLTVSTEWLIWQIFWDQNIQDPQFLQMTFYFHITSLILHLINAMMIWFLFRKLGIRLAWLGALLFTIHPVIVESVSWMAELKNTIAMPTFILAVVAWINFERTRGLGYYFAAFVLYVISMLTKTSCVMFPVIILLYDWWKQPETNFPRLLISEVAATFRTTLALLNFGSGYFRRVGTEVSQLRWTFVPTIPFFIVAILDAWFLILYLRHGVGEQFIPGLLGGPAGRTACAGLSLIFYFSKCILPVNLLPIYPQWVVTPPSFTLEYALKFLPWLVMAFGFGWLFKRREQPWARTAIFGFGFFFLNLLPFVGWRAISFMRFGWVMDHFLYVPILGLLGLAAAAAGDIYQRLPRAPRAWRIGAVSAVVVVVVIFTFGSHRYAKVFVNRLAYWTYCSKRNFVAWPSHNNRGNELLDEGNFDEAEKEFKIALMLNPTYTEAHNNLGYIYSRQGHYEEAEAEYREALTYTPDFESAEINRASVLVKLNRIPEAIAQFQDILKTDPQNQYAQQMLTQLSQPQTPPQPVQ